MRRTPVLIVGGGPAGAAAALSLARGGTRPLLVERSAAPRDVVCGGFLGWDGLRILNKLGLDVDALGARPIHRLRLVAGARMVEAELPHTSRGLSRRRLDEALLGAAEASGATVIRGQAVSAADVVARTVRIGDEEIACDALFVATGKHDLRGASRVQRSSKPRAVGLRAALPPSPARDRMLAGMVELHLFEGGYAGLLIQEDGWTNLCLSVSAERVSAAGGTNGLLREVLGEAPVLADRVGPDLPPRFLAVAGVPYGWRNQQANAGVFRVGDQAAVIASLAGDGIAIALTSGHSAAEAMLKAGGGASASWQRTFRRRSAMPLGIAEALRYAAERDRYRRPLLSLVRLAPGLATRAAALTRID